MSYSKQTESPGIQLTAPPTLAFLGQRLPPPQPDQLARAVTTKSPSLQPGCGRARGQYQPWVQGTGPCCCPWGVGTCGAAPWPLLGCKGVPGLSCSVPEGSSMNISLNASKNSMQLCFTNDTCIVSNFGGPKSYSTLTIDLITLKNKMLMVKKMSCVLQGHYYLKEFLSGEILQYLTLKMPDVATASLSTTTGPSDKPAEEQEHSSEAEADTGKSQAGSNLGTRGGDTTTPVHTAQTCTSCTILDL
ncbi:uncharacterized protein LOC109283044 isoform X2 [Alligator mississippiensis]|uniref:uncharacterized protein LOC109283044 isoform X2 n=1 Tax=Alligator mississippiensis TaxID=8496 RepID=UPI002877CFFC|nr:uncharacterized protein LOC109283044 isoform X2 [Alligator mississippiensis]